MLLKKADYLRPLCDNIYKIKDMQELTSLIVDQPALEDYD